MCLCGRPTNTGPYTHGQSHCETLPVSVLQSCLVCLMPLLYGIQLVRMFMWTKVQLFYPMTSSGKPEAIGAYPLKQSRWKDHPQ